MSEVKVRWHVELSEYNGWENKFTWLVHLHLSNEQALMQEVTALVVPVSRNQAAGRVLQMWVKASLFNWLGERPERDSRFDAEMHLFAWDMVGSALAYTDWDVLVRLLAGQGKKSKDLFTMALFRCIASDGQLQAFLSEMVQAYSSTYQCADTMHDWFREQIDMLFDGPDALPQEGMAALIHELLETSYRAVAWEHVARAFRPGY